MLEAANEVIMAMNYSTMLKSRRLGGLLVDDIRIVDAEVETFSYPPITLFRFLLYRELVNSEVG